MNYKRFSAVAVVLAAGLVTPIAAIASQSSISQSTAQAQTEPAARQVLDACVQNRAETLPNPFVDVASNHWAFKAVLTMHYCGAYRQATPPSLIDRLTNQQSPTQSPPPAQ